MKRSYTLWHGCYIDLYRKEGVATAIIEADGLIFNHVFSAKQNTTINELTLLAIKIGLSHISDDTDVRIIGVNKYADTALHKLGSWMSTDGEIDVKCHSELLKEIWRLMVMKSKMFSEFHLSRRADPMLWALSQAAGNDYRRIQETCIQNLKFPEGQIWEYPRDLVIEKKELLKMKFKTPMTDIQIEKAILKREKEPKQAAPLLRLVQ